MFNPAKRLLIGDALAHPYLMQFFAPECVQSMLLCFTHCVLQGRSKCCRGPCVQSWTTTSASPSRTTAKCSTRCQSGGLSSANLVFDVQDITRRNVELQKQWAEQALRPRSPSKVPPPRPSTSVQPAPVAYVHAWHSSSWNSSFASDKPGTVRKGYDLSTDEAKQKQKFVK